MKPRNAFVASASIGFVVLISGCAVLNKAVQKPKVSFEAVSVRSLSSESVTMDVHLNVQNPNVFDVPLKKYSYALNIGESRLLSGEQGLSITVPAKGSGQISVPLTVRFREVMGAIEAVTDTNVVPYSIGGTVTIDAGPLAGLTIPFNHSSSIPRPALPSITVERLSVSSVSLNGVNANLVLSVRNPGRLAYALENFAGDLELNGSKLATIDGIGGTRRLPGGSAQTISVPLRLSSAQALIGIQSLLNSGSISYRIKGTAGVSADVLGRMPLTIDQSGTTRISR